MSVKNTKKNLITATVLIAIVAGGGFYGWHRMGLLAQPVAPDAAVEKPQRLFADPASKHLEAGKNIGIANVLNDKKLSPKEKKQLEHIKTCKNYTVDKMMFSNPYLTPGAKTLLEEIAVNFADSLEAKSLVSSKIVVTNALMTKEDITNLKAAGNESATVECGYCYGTTFDISNEIFSRKAGDSVTPEQLSQVLAEVLRDEKSQGRCLVTFDGSRHIFTVTSLIAR